MAPTKKDQEEPPGDVAGGPSAPPEETPEEPKDKGGKNNADAPKGGGGGAAALLRVVASVPDHLSQGAEDEEMFQCSKCFAMVLASEKVSTGKNLSTHTCHPCHKSKRRADTLAKSSPELVQSFLEMGEGDLTAFIKAKESLNHEALKNPLSTKSRNGDSF